MIRALLVSLSLFSGLPLLAAEPSAPVPAATDKAAAAAIEAPALPPPVGAPPAAAPAAPPLAPPLPGQLQALPAQPRPALTPPVRIPEPVTPGATPAPTVPLNPLGATKPASSTSSSGQFIVHGDDLKLRSAFSGRCEEVAESLRQLLRDREPWELPIVVLLKTGDAARIPGPAVSYTISQISHGGFHLQVNVNVRGDLRPADVRAELIRVLLAERILRRQKELATDRARLLPDWVFTGVLEALDYRQRARPSALFAAIFKSGKIYGIEEIIEASASAIEDGLSKTIYQTSCCALVLALLEHPEGGMRMTKFLNSLASDKRPERELLNQWFPGFAATPASLNKWWSLQMATLASPSVSEPLTAAETAKQLEEALTLRFKAKSSELPRPRPVVAAAPHPEPEAKKEAPAETAKAETEEPAEAETKKPSFLSRLNPFAKKDKTDAEIIEDAAAEAALAEEPAASETKAPSPAPAPAPALGRKPLFARNAAEKEAPPVEDTVTVAEAAKPKPAADTKPAPEKAAPPASKETPPATPEEPKAEEKDKSEKGSVLNPLNWFRGGKKEKDKAKEETEPPPAEEETPAKKEKDKKTAEQAGLHLTGADLLWAWSPLAREVYVTAAQAAAEEEKPKAEEGPRKVEGFLGFKFGKKKDKDKAEAEAAAAEPEAPKPDTAKPKGKEAAKPEAPAKPAQESAPAPATPEKDQEETPKAPPAPMKIKPLFGGGKKDAPKTTPDEAPEAPATAETKPEAPAAAKPDAPAKPAKESAAAPEPAEKAQEAEMPKAPPAPIKIKPLFGSGKKDEEPKAATAETKPETPPAPEAKTAAAPKPKPKTPAPAVDASVDAALPIEDYATIMKRKDRAEILQRNINSLAALQTRAAVLYRPIVVEYSEVLAGILQGKTKGADERLRSLRARSAKALAQSKAVRDFVDLYEANESPVFSGLFDDYLKLPETIDKELPARIDPFSSYLDALDREFSKE